MAGSSTRAAIARQMNTSFSLPVPKGEPDQRGGDDVPLDLAGAGADAVQQRVRVLVPRHPFNSTASSDWHNFMTDAMGVFMSVQATVPPSRQLTWPGEPMSGGRLGSADIL